MIYCNLDPGLLVLQNLKPEQIDIAKGIFESLSMHRKNIVTNNVGIPITEEYMIHILESFSRLQIKHPPIEDPLRSIITELLGRTIKPLLKGSKISDVTASPEIMQEWVDDETRILWFDCLISAIFQKYSTDGIITAESENLIASFGANATNESTKITSNDLGELIDNKRDWYLPVISTNIEWARYIALISGWPKGLDSDLIEHFAYRNLNIPVPEIKNHRSIIFEAACLRDIGNEDNPNFRVSIIEVVACRAYDRVMPEHRDHKHRTQLGVRRVDVNKMNPPIRLHYYFDSDKVVYSLYENRDHNRGLI